MSNDATSSTSIRIRAEPVTRLRSTLITSSLQSLRSHGYEEAYLNGLDPAHKTTIAEAVAGVWLPIEVGIAHYRACDSLRLTVQQQLAVGGEVGARVHGTFLGVVVRSAKAAGITPWSGLEQATRLWERLFVGGVVVITKLGPKEARIDIEDNPLAAIGYFRGAFRGLIIGGALLFSQKAYSTELTRIGTSRSFAVTLSWV